MLSNGLTRLVMRIIILRGFSDTENEDVSDAVPLIAN